MARALKYLTVPAIDKHTATVIFVHGLGDTGHGWEPVAKMLNNELRHVKWILPHAETRRVTANFGMSMPAWFDIYSFGFNKEAKEDEEGMLSSVRSLNELISAEVDAGISSNRIVIGGFSQGGALSLLTGLTSERKLAGVAVLSGWLPIHQKFKSMLSQHALSTPIFWGHGTADPLLAYKVGEASKEYLLKDCGIQKAEDKEVNGLKFNSYQGMEHSSCPEEIQDLEAWIQAVVPKEEGTDQKQEGQL